MVKSFVVVDKEAESFPVIGVVKHNGGDDDGFYKNLNQMLNEHFDVDVQGVPQGLLQNIELTEGNGFVDFTVSVNNDGIDCGCDLRIHLTWIYG